MMTLTRQEIEILLDTPRPRSFVVSAFADMTVQDGFNRYVDQHLRNQARAETCRLEVGHGFDMSISTSAIRPARRARRWPRPTSARTSTPTSR